MPESHYSQQACTTMVTVRPRLNLEYTASQKDFNFRETILQLYA
ncbi:hypothetical protein BofuT4_P106830.1 [Botrytis cinerea T4]|uniref:Uncharacterized protein n=1 Tax=Botryotinia fuckeliana (strain T4) TaxID=999810 RepID=G2Y6P7_BOTF4|nr:hypothetical protein BofuT4_P106830.1 [Botrytis cinerea T4]